MSVVILLAAALVGALAGFFTAIRLLPGGRAPKGVSEGLIALATVAAAATHLTQRVLDSGLAFETVDLLERTAYFLFGFLATAAWLLLKTAWIRWWLAALIPVALFEPLRVGFALLWWGTKRLDLW